MHVERLSGTQYVPSIDHRVGFTGTEQTAERDALSIIDKVVNGVRQAVGL
ncbi:MAG: hypothetical protein ACYTF7_12005 [Planctomycetota bacterium]|jgi:hypothetical protein